MNEIHIFIIYISKTYSSLNFKNCTVLLNLRKGENPQNIYIQVIRIFLISKLDQSCDRNILFMYASF